MAMAAEIFANSVIVADNDSLILGIVRSALGRLGLTIFVKNLSDVRLPVYLYRPSVVASSSDAGLGRPGDYNQQLNADSFRTIGIAVDYHM